MMVATSRQRICIYAFVLLPLLLVGCATAPPSTSIKPRDASALVNWKASGRIAVSGANSGGSGSFDWSQNQDRSIVRLRGPVGIGSLVMTIDDRSIQLDAGDGPVQAEEAQAQLNARLGAVVPMQSLRYWMLGLAAPTPLNPGATEWTQSGDSQILQQDHWRIDYQRFVVADGVRLPAKWVATSTVNGSTAKVRVIVDQWKAAR